MKKWLVFCLFIVAVSPAFSQGVLEKSGEILLGESTLTLQLQKAIETQLPAVRLIQIAHFQEPVVVPVVSSLENLYTVPLELEKTPVCPARVLTPKELQEIVLFSSSPSPVAYVPSSFANAKKSLYRGMKISEISELKNILINGLEMNKSHYVGEIFTSPFIPVALNYALPTLWDKWEGEIRVDLPVLVRIPLTDKVWKENAPDQFATQWIFRKDVPADMISDVMVFLEVDGKPAWHKAVLKDGEIALVAVPGEYIKRPGRWD